MELPHLPFGSRVLGLVLGACLWGCGADDTTGAPSPDASTGDTGPNQGPDVPNASDDAVGNDALEDALAEGPDAGAAPPPDGGATAPDSGAGDSGAGDSGASDGAACTGAGDCQLFSDMCGTCACLALARSAAMPTCPGPPTECFKAPCTGLIAACQGGHCVAQSP